MIMTGPDHLISPRRAFTASLMLTRGDGGRGTRDAGVPVAGIEAAVASGDASAMLRAWHAACLDALGSQRWEPMIVVGDAARRIGQATGFTIAFAAKARQAYHVALYRAHKQGSRDGVRRAAEGFGALGDSEAVEQCTAIEERLAGRQESAGA